MVRVEEERQKSEEKVRGCNSDDGMRLKVDPPFGHPFQVRGKDLGILLLLLYIYS